MEVSPVEQLGLGHPATVGCHGGHSTQARADHTCWVATPGHCPAFASCWYSGTHVSYLFAIPTLHDGEPTGTWEEERGRPGLTCFPGRGASSLGVMNAASPKGWICSADTDPHSTTLYPQSSPWAEATKSQTCCTLPQTLPVGVDDGGALPTKGHKSMHGGGGLPPG